MSKYDIPRNRIFDSRSDALLSGIMRETNGRGVDVVPNSLAGKLLQASCNCVAKFGRMIELGKRNFMTHRTLGMSQFGGNSGFFGVEHFTGAGERSGVCTKVCCTITVEFEVPC